MAAAAATGRPAACPRPALPPSSSSWLPSSKPPAVGFAADKTRLLPCRHAAQQQRRAASGGAQATSPAGLRPLYPPPPLLSSGHLTVTDGHALHWEAYGNPSGVPAVFLHGGPGAGCFPNHARFCDPRHYRVVLLDQRGCGRSTPRGRLAHNTTAALVDDLEALRRHLGVDQWLLLGGSWGSALALAYAQSHPCRVLGLVLRGVCLMRPSEIHWMFGGAGAAALKPFAYEAFLSHLAPHERGNPLLGYYQRLLSDDPATRGAAAQAWAAWEAAVSHSSPGDMYVWDGSAWATQQLQQQQQPLQQQRQRPAPPPGPGAAPLPRLPRGAVVPAEVLAGSAGAEASPQHVRDRCAPALGAGAAAGGGAGPPGAWEPGLPVQGANLGDPRVQALLWRGLNHAGDGGGGSSVQPLLECHYSLHGGFLLEAPLLEHVGRLRGIPAVAVQGQLDFVCPPATAADLHRAWPELELRLVPGAGHSMYDPAITDQLVRATDRMRALRPVSPVAAA